MLLASFKIYELRTQQKKPHNVREEVILTATNKISEIMFGAIAEEEMSNIPYPVTSLATEY